MKTGRDDRMIRMRLDRIARLCRGDVLDVGCGASILKGLLPSGGYTGMDIACGDIRGSALELPIGSMRFDTVVLCEILEHLENPAGAIREAARVARGRLIISVPNEYSLVRLARLAAGREIEPEAEHVIDLTASHLKRYLASSGFTAVSAHAFPIRLQGFPTIALPCRFGYWSIIAADRVAPGSIP
jgi:2-polyprenyl-3-methyl-5-hydroxy-6-metoxy-1,4-benzoquinol methylase